MQALFRIDTPEILDPESPYVRFGARINSMIEGVEQSTKIQRIFFYSICLVGLFTPILNIPSLIGFKAYYDYRIYEREKDKRIIQSRDELKISDSEFLRQFSALKEKYLTLQKEYDTLVKENSQIASAKTRKETECLFLKSELSELHAHYQTVETQQEKTIKRLQFHVDFCEATLKLYKLEQEKLLAQLAKFEEYCKKLDPNFKNTLL